MHPVDHFELPFAAFNGAVNYGALDVPVNIPVIWTAIDQGQGPPAGTPMVQVIPYVRNAMPTASVVHAETAEETVARTAALTRKYTEESIDAREWRHHERQEPS